MMVRHSGSTDDTWVDRESSEEDIDEDEAVLPSTVAFDQTKEPVVPRIFQKIKKIIEDNSASRQKTTPEERKCLIESSVPKDPVPQLPVSNVVNPIPGEIQTLKKRKLERMYNRRSPSLTEPVFEGIPLSFAPSMTTSQIVPENSPISPSTPENSPICPPMADNSPTSPTVHSEGVSLPTSQSMERMCELQELKSQAVTRINKFSELLREPSRHCFVIDARCALYDTHSRNLQNIVLGKCELSDLDMDVYATLPDAMYRSALAEDVAARRRSCIFSIMTYLPLAVYAIAYISSLS